jgi:hypothetical protein
VVEADGELVRSWLPGLEADSREGPIDRGGFCRYADALAFSLGVDIERAFHGHLPGITAKHIEEERAALDLPGAAAACPKEEPVPEPEPAVATLPEPPELSADEQERWNLELKRRLQLHRVA